MNKKAQASFTVGIAITTVAFVFALVLFATLDPFKEALDDTRGNSALNCPGTSNFNQTDFDDDSASEKLGKRSTCFVTGITMIWFFMAFIIALFVWVFKNWSRTR